MSSINQRSTRVVASLKKLKPCFPFSANAPNQPDAGEHGHPLRVHVAAHQPHQPYRRPRARRSQLLEVLPRGFHRLPRHRHVVHLLQPVPLRKVQRLLQKGVPQVLPIPEAGLRLRDGRGRRERPERDADGQRGQEQEPDRDEAIGRSQVHVPRGAPLMKARVH